MYKQLLDGHKACKTTLSLTRCQRERLIGLTNILSLSLQNCSTVTMVKTSIYDVDTTSASVQQIRIHIYEVPAVTYLRVRIMLCNSVFK